MRIKIHSGAIGLLLFGIVLLFLGVLLSVRGWLPLAIFSLILGLFFCAAGIGTHDHPQL